MAHAGYLERSGVQAELGTALSQLVIEQPEDPILFLANQ